MVFQKLGLPNEELYITQLLESLKVFESVLADHQQYLDVSTADVRIAALASRKVAYKVLRLYRNHVANFALVQYLMRDVMNY